MSYLSMDLRKLEEKESELLKEYDALKKQGININMTRGKPCKEQLDLSEGMLTAIATNADCYTDYGFDCRNYGLVDGLDYAKKNVFRYNRRAVESDYCRRKLQSKFNVRRGCTLYAIRCKR